MFNSAFSYQRNIRLIIKFHNSLCTVFHLDRYKTAAKVFIFKLLISIIEH